ncbi:MAG: hypothetical protein NZL93_05880 [Chthoniobacterales bacterium]|nr:hypothetical protein [Chthoniobacterales bacterium]
MLSQGLNDSSIGAILPNELRWLGLGPDEARLTRFEPAHSCDIRVGQ